MTLIGPKMLLSEIWCSLAMINGSKVGHCPWIRRKNWRTLTSPSWLLLVHWSRNWGWEWHCCQLGRWQAHIIYRHCLVGSQSYQFWTSPATSSHSCILWTGCHCEYVSEWHSDDQRSHKSNCLRWFFRFGFVLMASTHLIFHTFSAVPSFLHTLPMSQPLASGARQHVYFNHA